MVSFVYFDLGGVVEIDLSPPKKWTEMKRGIGINADQDVEFDKFWSTHEPSLCIGSKDLNSLVPLIKKQFHLNLPKDYSMLKDFVDRFEVNESIWPIIDEIHSKCRIGLLTNMYPGMYQEIQRKEILPRVDWDVVIDSNVVHLQKPDLEIYKLAEAKAGCGGGEVLFVDNIKKNIEAAKELAWQTFLYDPVNPFVSSEKLLDFFKQNK